MTNNIQKAFKTKSKLRCMADGGQLDPNVLGSGMAQRAGAALQGRRAQLDAAIDAASNGDPPPRPAPTPATAAPAKKPEEKSALRSFFGLADGGQVFKNTVGGVPTFTDARAATAGAKAYTPGSGGGTFSVIGMEPEQKQQMADAAAQRKAAAAAPTTLGGRLDAALGKLGSSPTTAGAPSSTPTLGSELDAAIGRTQGVTSAQTPATGAPANDVSRTMGSQKMGTFNNMSQSAIADAAQMRDIGLSASRTPSIPTDTVFPSQLQQDYQDFFGLADGGKVKGKGGPTDDKVGPVMLSDGEYVLPADTVDIVGRDKLDALRLATHDFVDDDNKPKASSLRKMVNGGGVYKDPLTLAPPRFGIDTATGGGLVPPSPPNTNMTVYHPPEPLPRPAVAPSGGAVGPYTGQTVYPRAAPAAAQAATQAAAPAAASKLGNAVRTGGTLLGAGLEAKNVYNAYQSGGVDAAVSEAEMSAARLAAARLGASVGVNLPLPGWGKPVMAGVLGTAGYVAPDVIGNSEFAKEEGRKNALREAFSSRIDEELAPKFNPRTNTITTSDGHIFGSGRLESNPHLQYQGYLSAKVDQSINSRAPLFNPTASELEAIGALRPRNSNPSTDPKFNPTVADLERDGALRPAVPMDSAMRALRSGKEPGGGFTQTNVPGIFGRKSSDPKNDLGEYIGVGKPDPQEDPIMDEIRSALRGLTDGAGNRGGGSYGGGSTAFTRGAIDEINKRYDAMLRNGAGQNRVRGLDWSQRHGLDVERARASELGEFARNQSALRGQDVSADGEHARTAAYLRAQAAQNLTTILEGRQRALAAMGKDSKPDKPIDTDTFLDSTANRLAGGDKETAAKIRVKLVNLPEQTLLDLQAMPQVDRTRAVSDLLDVDNAARNDAQTGRDAGAMAARAGAFGVAAGSSSALARASARKLLGENAPKARNVAALIDKGIGFIPKIGKPISKLRLFERLASLASNPLAATAAGGLYGAATTPDRGELSPKETYSFATDADANGNPIPVTEGNSWWTNANRYGPIDATLPGFADNYVFNNAHVAVKRPDMDAQAATERVRKRKSKLRDSDGGE